MIHFRGSELLHFLAFLKKQLFKLLHVISKYYFKTICKYQQGIPKLWYPSSRLPKPLKKAWELLLPCCTISPQPRLTLQQLLHGAFSGKQGKSPQRKQKLATRTFWLECSSIIKTYRVWMESVPQKGEMGCCRVHVKSKENRIHIMYYLATLLGQYMRLLFHITISFARARQQQISPIFLFLFNLKVTWNLN